MMNADASVYLRRARAGLGPSLYVAASYDQVLRQQDPYFPSSCLFQYVLANDSWLAHDLPQYVTAICPATFPDAASEALVAISAEGEVTVKRGSSSSTEQIRGAGLNKEPHRGRMFGVRMVGESIFACGEGGQLYRRESLGRWTLLDPALLKSDSSKVMEELDRNADDISQLLAVDVSGVISDARRKSFLSVGGRAENDLYVCGYDGSLVQWDGLRARWLEGVPQTQLLNVFVSPDRRIWVCGSGATLLCNDGDGRFQDMLSRSDLTLNSMAWFQDQLWLTANGGFGGPYGLFSYDGKTLRQVSSGLIPDIEDVHSVDAADGILWVVGARDILCFDGRSWRRIDHPDNPPVR